jgi:hypothetical protein
MDEVNQSEVHKSYGTPSRSVKISDLHEPGVRLF